MKEQSRDRVEILTDLVHLKGKVVELQKELSKYTWDTEVPLLIVSKIDFTDVLKRVIKNEISITELEEWANAIECRDDLDFEVTDIQEIVFELANPEINGMITRERLLEIINKLLA